MGNTYQTYSFTEPLETSYFLAIKILDLNSLPPPGSDEFREIKDETAETYYDFDDIPAFEEAERNGCLSLDLISNLCGYNGRI